ncbi:2-iminoacetate synthase ThiH [Vibrio salinus]|uniref:2-iminoacetate synthase ThiH n=1 Tax=Vibrio salinus TaxID=2899784 RepID=UPI001E594222|nr:2-iminoacetate synthase ThiH [Vibrio salinus]MCE0493597.1 2-iminoacetate synthase ThiH [Vibrio salinus]
MSFVDQLNDYNWDDVRLSIYSKTERDVQRALTKSRLTLEDFKALISPVAEKYIEPLAQKARYLTRQRFGNTVSMYIPLYLSNLCSNDCTYCGFSMSNRIKRKILSEEEIMTEIAAIKKMNFDSLLLVTGEHQAKGGMDYFRAIVPMIKEHFHYLAMEVQPLSQEDYVELRALGIDAVMVYQETYNRVTYAKHHLRGHKMDFEYRLLTPDRLGNAGIDKIGIGALIGLDDWRTDCFFTAAHLNYLEKRYWQSRYSISFPRLRPCAGSIEPKSIMTDAQLLQLICAYRLFDPEVELSLSTRESPIFRDNVVPIAITSLSAASKTQPGGYANNTPELEQFAVSDNRSAPEVIASMKGKGLETVWKDWESVYSG